MRVETKTVCVHFPVDAVLTVEALEQAILLQLSPNVQLLRWAIVHCQQQNDVPNQTTQYHIEVTVLSL
jgi:hypothetical protein